MLRAVLVCATVALAVTRAAAAPLHVGLAAVDITPPTAYRMSGYFYERVSTGIKDPLQAKAVVFTQGNESAAIVCCDLIGVPRSLTQKARSKASQATGIPQDHITITATHTHTAPLYYGPLRTQFHRQSVERHGSDLYETTDYSALLVDAIVRAIEQAHEAVQPTSLKAGFATQEGLAFNRRFHMRDGSVRFNPGRQNPDIVRPAGPVDQQVGIVSLESPDQHAPYAALVSFALHLDTIHGTEFSADYPKPMEDRLREAFGPKFTAVFATGTCGDINHIDVSKTEEPATETIGSTLGDTVVGAIRSNALTPVESPALAVRTTIVEAPLQEYSPAEIAKATENLSRIGGRELSFLEQVETYKIMALQEYASASLPLEVHTIRLSDDVAIVTLPAEVFVELGLAIKAASPFKTTLVLELANDSLGYIPTKRAFAEGSYEVVNSRVAAGGGEMLVEAAKRLLKELK